MNSNTVRFADTVFNPNKFTLQTGSLKEGFGWNKKIKNKYELYAETGFLLGNNISLTGNDFLLKENMNLSAYFQIGFTVNFTKWSIKHTNGKTDNNTPLNKRFNPSMYNIERIFLD